MKRHGRLAGGSEVLRESYWFVPGLLAFAGFAAAIGLVYLDAVAGSAWLSALDWFYASRPSGAREVLSAIAGSTITVAGVVFSITLAATTYASGQYGPQLLTNFSRDRGNQVTLGVFVGTFLYCLVVLRTIRSAEEASADTGGAVREAFVPDLAVFGAMALAIASIGVLVYFVHHVTDSIHVNNVIARIGRGLLADVAKRDEDASDRPAEAPPEGGRPCRAPTTGYLRLVDEQGLARLARERRVAVRLLVRPGDFVHRGQTVAVVTGGGEEETAACRDALTIGRRRSDAQDPGFGIDQLVQIAARALSPGANDPFTACACIDWLGAALLELANAPRRAERLEERVWIPRRGFPDHLDTAAGRLRPYAARDRMTTAHLAATLERIGSEVGDPTHRRLIARERAALITEAAQG